MPVYNKLVRDFTPTYLDRLGFDYRTRTLDEGEYRERLLDKLVEETAELRVASTEGEQREELADVLEVVGALADLLGGRDLIEKLRVAKAVERGAFAQRLLLEEIHE